MSISVRKGASASIEHTLIAQFNNLRQTVAKNSSQFHADITSLGTTGSAAGLATAASITSTLPANATDLPTSLALANALQSLSAMHAADAVNTLYHNAGSHLIADTTNAPTLAAIPAATTLVTAEAVANGLKAFWNAHFTQTGVHVGNDGTNTISAAAATDQGTTNTLLNAVKTAVVAHVASAPSGLGIRLIDP